MGPSEFVIVLASFGGHTLFEGTLQLILQPPGEWSVTPFEWPPRAQPKLGQRVRLKSSERTILGPTVFAQCPSARRGRNRPPPVSNLEVKRSHQGGDLLLLL